MPQIPTVSTVFPDAGRKAGRSYEVLQSLTQEMKSLSVLFGRAECDYLLPADQIKINEDEASIFVYMQTRGALRRYCEARREPYAFNHAGFLVRYISPTSDMGEHLHITVQPAHGLSPVDSFAEEILTPADQGGIAIAWRLKEWANPETLRKLTEVLGGRYAPKPVLLAKPS